MSASDSHPPTVTGLDMLVDRLAHFPKSRIIGLAGAPGSGKSTVSKHLSGLLENSVVVPMDGFHYSNEELNNRGLRHKKGAPETFDSTRFVEALAQVQERQGDVFFPEFDRSIDASREAQIRVTPEHEIIVVEGNYLLLEFMPWSRIRDLLDLAIYIERDEAMRLQQLRARHIEFGKTPSAAETWIADVDQPNAELVKATRAQADLVFHNDGTDA